MKIAISGDCLSVFTSAYPVRGMLLELIKQRQDDLFIIFYTQRPRPKMLKSFFEQLHALPNVKTRYFKWNRYVVGLQRFLTLSNYFPIDNSYDIFIFGICPSVQRCTNSQYNRFVHTPFPSIYSTCKNMEVTKQICKIFLFQIERFECGFYI